MATLATSRYRPVAPAALEQRRADRHRLSVTRAGVRRHADRAVEAALHDISVYGCRIAIDAPHLPGERLWLRFGGGLPLAATVVWSEGGLAGCRFDAAIPGVTVRALILADGGGGPTSLG